MARNRYVSIAFNSGVKQQVPKTLLPLPLLTRAENLVIKDEGRLESRPNFQQLSGAQLPSNAGKPLSLFTRNNQLYAITDRNILSYISSQRRWEDFYSQFGDLRRGRRRNMEIKTHQITQKEKDIQHLAFAKWANDYLVFFYIYENQAFSAGTIFYKVWSIPDQRVVGGEQRISNVVTTAVTGLYALNVGNQLWLGISTAENIQALNFNPITGGQSNFWRASPAVSGVTRFKLLNDRIFYHIGTNPIQSQVYNPTATDKYLTGTPVTIRDSLATAQDYSNRSLFDFYEWVDFSYRPEGVGALLEEYKLVWSIQSGFFLINQNNRIISHLYGNFTPYTRANPPRMVYTGATVNIGGDIYVPVLRSGQPEVVNVSAVTDRVVEGGRIGSSEVATVRPLGLELVHFNLLSETPPQTAQIDDQMMISGSLLNWTDGQSVSEFSFTERPRIEKTDRDDYDKWPYSNLDVTLPRLAELERDQYTEVSLNFTAKISPYLVEPVSFKASTANGGDADGDWQSSATTAKRTLRFSTDISDGTISDAYGGVLSRVHYEDSAVVAEFSSAPTTLADDKDHPQVFFLNGIRYDIHYWNVQSGVLKAYHYTSQNPFTSGNDYEVKIPKTDIVVSTNDAQSVQVADEDNRNTAISLNTIRLRRNTEKRIGRVQGVEEPLNTASISMATLKRDGTRGAVSSDLADVLDIKTQAGEAEIVFGSTATDRNLTMPSANVNEIAGTGDDVYVLGANRRLVVFNKTTKARQNSKEFSITPVSSDYSVSGLTISGGDLLVLETSNGGSRQRVAKYSLSSRNRGSVFDITSDRTQIGSDIMAQGSLFWILQGTALRAHLVSNGARQRGSDKTLGSSVAHISTDGTTILGVGSSTGPVRVFSFSNGTQTDTFTRPRFGQNNQINGLWFDGDIAYLTFLSTSTVHAFNGKAKDAILATSLGLLSNTRIRGTQADIVGIEETSDDKLYLYFGGAKSTYSNSASLSSALITLLKGWTFSRGDNEYIFDIPSGFAVANSYSDTNNNYVRYEIIPNPSQLQDILEEDRISVLFTKKEVTSFEEIDTLVEPAVLNAVYSGFNELGSPKDITVQQVNPNSQFFLGTDRNTTDSFFFSDDTFQKLGTRSEYYFATTNNPLPINEDVFSFTQLKENLIFRYPLVNVNPDVTAEQLLTAEVYNYLCRFKWLDENGLEHRSQLSEPVQLVTNSPIGRVGNQPTFNVKHLNLTNKPQASVSIEIYRTQNKSRTFQLLKEVVNKTTTEQTTITDDVEDSGLGGFLSADKVLTSSADFVTTYRGRFVLWGFPDQPNRVLISSPRRPFNNKAIAFDRSGAGNDAEVLLMESPVKRCETMDSYLLIFCEGQVYSWDVSGRQDPRPVSALNRISARGAVSSVLTTEGTLFEGENGLGLHILTRGLTWRFEGEAVKRATSKGDVLSICKKEKTEDIVILKKENTDDPDQPKVLVYNQRYKQWTSYHDRDLLSCVVWNKSLTSLTESGEIFQEMETAPTRTRTFTIETGWLAFNQAYMDFKRVREIYLLAEFEGLENLTLTLDSDFIDGNNAETISGRVSAGMFVLAGMSIPVENLKVFRFQPRQQEVQALRIKITATARTAKFDALRFGIDAGPAMAGQQGVRGAGGPVVNIGA